MKIDTHLHVMFKPLYGRRPGSVEELLDGLSECGLDGGWISSIDSMLTRDLNLQKKLNDSLAEITRKHPGRIAALCTVDPGGMDDAAAEIGRCVGELNMIGVKLHPWLQAFSVTHPGMRSIMEAVSDLEIPVIFHDGTPPYSSPTQIAWLAGKYPKARVVFGHSGLADFWRETADLAMLHDNIWLQPTGAPPVAIKAALDAVGPERLLFGSDGGYAGLGFIRYSLSKYRSVLEDEIMNSILTDTPKRLAQRHVGVKVREYIGSKSR